jgi:hypothetical protein
VGLNPNPAWPFLPILFRGSFFPKNVFLVAPIGKFSVLIGFPVDGGDSLSHLLIYAIQGFNQI